MKKFLFKNLFLFLIVTLIFSMIGCAKMENKEKISQSAYSKPAENYVNGVFVQTPDYRDYSFMWWAQGFKGFLRQMNIQTGYYGLAMNAVTGGITRIGSISKPVSETEAFKGDNSKIDELPAVSMNYNIECNGKKYDFSKVDAVEGGDNSTRILESGRYMQRLDILYLTYKNNKSLKGRLEVACTPEFLSMTYDMYSNTAITNAKMEFSISVPETYTKITWSLDNTAVTLTDEKGAGITYCIPGGSTAKMAISENNLVFSCDGISIPKNKFTGFSIIAIPRVKATPEDAAEHKAIENVTVTATQVMPNNGSIQEVTNDKEKGYHSISLEKMYTKVLDQQNTEEIRNTYDELKFTIKNDSNKTVKVPIQFFKKDPLSVTGMSPLLRDPNTGEPIGVQVQLTKNWHNYSTTGFEAVGAGRPYKDPARFWEGKWFHGYTLIEVPAGKSVTYDYTCTYAQWGGIYAASHAQLCLVGWGGNQQWETAALGSFGEAFCYDAQEAWVSSFLADICPTAITSRLNNKKYTWTVNIGAADFLIYTRPNEPNKVKFSRMKTRFKKQGPNLTEVLYSGISEDGSVLIELSASLPRTDDGSKSYHSFKYTFLKDTEFSRMVFYQFGADQYNVGIYDRMAVGNDDGTTSFEINGKKYSGEFALPKSTENKYLDSDKMQRLEIGGKGMWFSFLGGQHRPEEQGAGANKVLTLQNYHAVINGKTYDKPAFNIRTTNTIYEGALIELCPTADVGNMIKAGSVVSGVVEFINLPAEKADYYGPSTVLKNYPESDFNTWKLSHLYATQSKTTVTASIGKVLKTAPVEVEAIEKGSTICDFTITGGIGYVPITIKGVPTYSGWQLQINKNGKWENIDQSIHGNDYWQAWYDAENGKYELTYNVPHDGSGKAVEYRLNKK